MRNARLQKEEKEGVLDKKSTFKGKGGGQDFFQQKEGQDLDKEKSLAKEMEEACTNQSPSFQFGRAGNKWARRLVAGT